MYHNYRQILFFSGYLSEGGDVSIIRDLRIQLTFKCQFKLELFPFGSQECFFLMKPLLNIENNDVELFIKRMHEPSGIVDYDFLKEDVRGEYSITYMNDIIMNGDGTVSFQLSLESTYGFYVLNTYLPSALIWFISYSSLYFPLRNFNERVMVSLTSLLVLTSFFTQASEFSVYTPYPKMIDIWFTCLISGNFLVVIFNVIINNIYLKNTNTSMNVVHTKSYFPDERVKDKHSVNTSGERVNLVVKLVLLLNFVMFLTWYGLVANQVIPHL